MSPFALRRQGLSLTTAAAVVMGAMALAGCGAGQITQTSTQVSAVDGASATVGQVGVRNASIIFGSGRNAAVYSAGGAAPLQMSIVNFGGTDDRLVSASSAVAGSVTITGDPRIAGGRTLRISGGGGSSEGAGAAGSAAPSATGSVVPGATATPTTGTPSSAARTSAAAPTATTAATTTAVLTPAADGTTSASIVLSGLKQDIRAGLTYPVEFTFANAGTVTIQVPVANPSEPRTAAAG